MPPIEMVCFDLGGVIVKHHRSWKDTCAAIGMPYIEAVADPALVERRRALTRLYHVGHIETDDFFAALAAATGNLYTVGQVRTLHDAWVYAEYEGIDAVLERLVALNRAQTGILSNTNAMHWARLGHGTREGLPLFSAPLRLQHRHASHLLRLAKPDPSIYRAYEDETEVRGRSVLFFDDLPENIAAAKSFDWDAVLIDHTGDTAAQVEAALKQRWLI